MLLIYNEEQMQLHRDETAMATILEKVSEAIETEDVAFSHLLVDGAEIYENHEQYVQERIDTIEKIEIVTFKVKEMIWETLQSVDTYLQRALPALEQTVDQSYDQFTEETWTSISQLIEGLDWMLQFKNFTATAKQQPVGFDKFEEAFAICEEQFTPMLDAIEAQDTVFISDILAYEILPAFKELSESTRAMLQDIIYIS